MSQASLGEALALKPTRVLTKMSSAKDILSHRCQGHHRHVTLLDGKAGPCAKYPRELCEAMLQCLQIELAAKQEVLASLEISSLEAATREDLHEPDMTIEEWAHYAGHVDDVTWEPLDPVAVKAGAQKEMKKLQ